MDRDIKEQNALAVMRTLKQAMPSIMGNEQILAIRVDDMQNGSIQFCNGGYTILDWPMPHVKEYLVSVADKQECEWSLVRLNLSSKFSYILYRDIPYVVRKQYGCYTLSVDMRKLEQRVKENILQNVLFRQDDLVKYALDGDIIISLSSPSFYPVPEKQFFVPRMELLEHWRKDIHALDFSFNKLLLTLDVSLTSTRYTTRADFGEDYVDLFVYWMEDDDKSVLALDGGDRASCGFFGFDNSRPVCQEELSQMLIRVEYALKCGLMSYINLEDAILRSKTEDAGYDILKMQI